MSWNFNPMAGPWLATHVWEYYDYTKDLKFLKETGYELIKAAPTLLLTISGINRTERIRLPPLLHRNTALSIRGATFVHAVVREILLDAIQASKELGIDKRNVNNGSTCLPISSLIK